MYGLKSVAHQIVQRFDPSVLFEEVFLLLTRPRTIVNVHRVIGTRTVRVARSVNADCLQTRILRSDPTNKRLGNWIHCEVIEVLEEWKHQHRKETFRGHLRTCTDTQQLQLWKQSHESYHHMVKISIG